MHQDLAKLTTLPKIANPLVVAIAYDGLCTFEFGVAVEAFGLARPEMGDNWYKFAVASVDSGMLRAAGGVCIMADGGLDLVERAGTIVIPGWRGINAPVPEELKAALVKANDRGVRIVTICSGVFVLAAAGLLHGRRATTHWRYTEVLQQRYPDIQVMPDVLYVDEGNILTSAGSAAGIDACLHLIRRDFGTKAANSVARRLVVPPHREGGQAQFIQHAVPVPHEGERLSRLFDSIRANIAQQHSISSLARLAGMSPRTFLRRFEAATGTTPARWILLERLSRVCELLENTNLSIEQVAEISGFGSATAMRHHFRKQYHTTPASYRETFKNIPAAITALKAG